ncbi:hypothetical protein [Lactococcus lactis]|uniref:hypothetical protein n=1 Tax=Lactococcus lactis TaxID=1358 RepID=UPI0018C642F3|nr:hypothetical protein [Lactococcus lactis]MBG1279299.1 hypothetical protein [Lactococcus lactis subsp. lactis]
MSIKGNKKLKYKLGKFRYVVSIVTFWGGTLWLELGLFITILNLLSLSSSYKIGFLAEVEAVVFFLALEGILLGIYLIINPNPIKQSIKEIFFDD